VGQTLENSLRPTDFLGRWQENQFLAILTECSATEITCASERLRRMVSGSKIAWWGDRLPVIISEQALQQSIVHGGNRTTVLHA
jgi:GGDEF domain-containing protein